MKKVGDQMAKMQTHLHHIPSVSALTNNMHIKDIFSHAIHSTKQHVNKRKQLFGFRNKNSEKRQWEVAIKCTGDDIEKICCHIQSNSKINFTVIRDNLHNLILVSATDDCLIEYGYQIQVSDWVKSGGKGSCPSMESYLHKWTDNELTASEKILFLTYILKTSMKIDNEVIALHDKQANISFLLQHDFRKLGLMTDNELDKIRCHFGDEVGFYYAWITYYNTSLVPLAIIGTIVELSTISFPNNTHNLIGLYSFVVITWTHVVVKHWIRRQSVLIHRWNLEDVSDHLEERLQFYGTLRKLGDDLYEMWYPPWKRFLKYILSVPICLVLLSFVLFGAGIAFGFEIWLWYTASGKKLMAAAGFLSFVVGALPDIFFGLVFDEGLWALFIPITVALAKWENHKFQNSYESSVINKLYSFYFVSIFMYYFCVAFIYIPFGNEAFSLIPFWSEKVIVDKNRFKTLIRNTFLVTQFAKLAVKLLLPIFLKQLEKQAKKQINKIEAVARKRSCKGADKDLTNDGTSQLNLRQILEEVDRSEYITFLDFAENAAQFSKIAFFSVAYPAAPMIAIITNIIEQKIDMVTICYRYRRAVPKRVCSIGAWLGIFQFAGSSSILVNIGILMLTMGYHDNRVLKTITEILTPTCTATPTCNSKALHLSLAIIECFCLKYFIQFLQKIVDLIIPDKSEVVSQNEWIEYKKFEKNFYIHRCEKKKETEEHGNSVGGKKVHPQNSSDFKD